MRLKSINIIAVLCVLISSCEDPYKESTFTAYEQVPAATYIKEHPEQFSQWAELIDQAGLFNTLNLDGINTFFVPNDSAMSIYLQKHNYSAVSDIEKADAAYLIKYHLLTSIAFDQSQFENGAIPRSTETDDDLTIEFREGGLNAIYLNGEARFVSLDIEVTNGIIHEIGGVLEPITATVYDNISNSRYGIFKDAIDATGYGESLSKVYQIDTIDGAVSSKRFAYTAFAVSDSVYNLDGISSLADLNIKLGTVGTSYLEITNELNVYVSYHLLGTLKSTAALGNLIGNETSTNINTLAENQIINLTTQNGQLVMNKEVNGSGIAIIAENIACRNGVIHELGNWMPLFTPLPVTVRWDLADQADIASLADDYQRSDLTGGYYQRSFLEDELTSYIWKSSPEGRSGVVVYRNNRNNDGVYYQTLNYDHMRFTTGPSGYVETITPVLIKGTYKITIGYVSYRATAPDGVMIASMDGSQLGSQLVTSNTNQDRISTHVLSEAFQFNETKSHNFRIVGIDGKLLALDYLLFEPLD